MARASEKRERERERDTEKDTETESERARERGGGGGRGGGGERERPANTHEGDSARVAQVIVGEIEARDGVFLAGKYVVYPRHLIFIIIMSISDDSNT